MVRLLFSRLVLSLLLLSLFVPSTTAVESRCHSDCEMHPGLRVLGPTKPDDAMDPIGHALYLTMPYPYFHSGQEAAKVTIESNVRLRIPAWDLTASYGDALKGVHLKFVKMVSSLRRGTRCTSVRQR